MTWSTIIEILVMVALAYLSGCVLGALAKWIVYGRRPTAAKMPGIRMVTTPTPIVDAIPLRPIQPAGLRPAVSAARRLAAAANDEPDLEPLSASAAEKLTGVAPPPPDELRRIRGIGPAIERRLHDLGITTYEQIAAWSAEDVAAIEANFAFKGRIARDNWVGQARDFLGGQRADVA